MTKHRGHPGRSSTLSHRKIYQYPEARHPWISEGEEEKKKTQNTNRDEMGFYEFFCEYERGHHERTQHTYILHDQLHRNAVRRMPKDRLIEGTRILHISLVKRLLLTYGRYLVLCTVLRRYDRWGIWTI